MTTKAHNSIYVMRGLSQLGQVDKPISLEIALDSIYASCRTWFPDFK